MHLRPWFRMHHLLSFDRLLQHRELRLGHLFGVPRQLLLLGIYLTPMFGLKLKVEMRLSPYNGILELCGVVPLSLASW